MTSTDYILRGLCGAPVPTVSTTTVYLCCLALGHRGPCWAWGAST